jgi:two-component system, NarL family, response regulator DevR
MHGTASEPAGSTRPPIGVYLLDDHELVRRGLHHVIDRAPDLSVVGEAGLACDALREIPALLPDVALLDAHLPDGNGIEVCRQVRSQHPEVACLMLTAFDDAAGRLSAVTAGAAGYLLKHGSAASVGDAVRRAAAGESLLDPGITQAVFDELGDRAARTERGAGGVTGQERVVLELIAEGLTNRQIGERLFLPEKTVKIHITRLVVKLGILTGRERDG